MNKEEYLGNRVSGRNKNGKLKVRDEDRPELTPVNKTTRKYDIHMYIWLKEDSRRVVQCVWDKKDSEEVEVLGKR